jgi:hypothetical protein
MAQHGLDAETRVEMRKMFREKGPASTIEEDVAAIAGDAPSCGRAAVPGKGLRDGRLGRTGKG